MWTCDWLTNGVVIRGMEMALVYTVASPCFIGSRLQNSIYSHLSKRGMKTLPTVTSSELISVHSR